MTPVKGSLNPQRGCDPKIEKHCSSGCFPKISTFGFTVLGRTCHYYTHISSLNLRYRKMCKTSKTKDEVADSLSEHTSLVCTSVWCHGRESQELSLETPIPLFMSYLRWDCCILRLPPLFLSHTLPIHQSGFTVTVSTDSTKRFQFVRTFTKVGFYVAGGGLVWVFVITPRVKWIISL